MESGPRHPNQKPVTRPSQPSFKLTDSDRAARFRPASRAPSGATPAHDTQSKTQQITRHPQADISDSGVRQAQPSSSQVVDTHTNSRLPLKSLSYGLSGALVLAGLVVGAAFLLRTPKTISKDIRQQVSYGIFYPSDDKTIKADPNSLKYNSSQGNLTVNVTTKSGTIVHLSEQATPESFVDVPTAYDKLINSLQPYSSFDSINGKVNLTHPKELRGDQSAVMNSKGTLLFARPEKGIDLNQWRELFNNIQIIK